jgi:mannose-6-phosphate isomerase-like protein (cupin superfamily)
MQVININEKFNLFNDQWSPKVVGELNGQQVKLAKVEGEFIWHDHATEDEMFLVIKGTLKIEFRDRMLTIKEGEFCIVPMGIEHKPIAEEEVWIMLFEPKATKHTGNVEHEKTVKEYAYI